MQELIKKALDKENIELSSNKIEQLTEFGNKLEWWNSTHNITGAKTKEDIVKNIIDSIVPTTFVDKPKSMLDVGTGAGFPGLILAIIWEDTQTTLAEPLNKRASFLRYMIQDLELSNCEVFKNRVEKLTDKNFELVTSRAVTNTKLLLDLTQNVTSSNTNYLFFKGERVYQEIEELKAQYIYNIVTKNRRNYLLIKGKKAS